MDQTVEKVDLLKEGFSTQFQNFEQSLNGDKNLPLHQIRQEAFFAFQNLSFPVIKQEEWKYTDISKALSKNFNFEKPNPIVSYTAKEAEKAELKGLDAHYLVFVNGIFHKELSKITGLDAGVIVENLDQASQKYDVFSQYFSKHIDYKKDIFSALSTAFAKNGVFIHVPKGKVVEKPFIFEYITDTSAGNIFAQPRNLIILGEHSSAHFCENYSFTGNNNGFTNAVTEIIVKEGAIGEYYKVQNESEKSFHVGTTQIYQESNSNFSSTTISLNCGMARNNLNVILDGQGCESKMFGLYLLEGNMHVDNHTVVDHAKPHSHSNELYKGIMDGNSKGVFNGKIFVRQDAQKTNAFQSNRNILLSDNATVNTKPQLEIWADDVKCSHGTTTGQIDMDAIFYLRSRGIGEDKAKALLMFAFAQDILENVKIEALKTYLEDLISSRLKKDF